MYILLSLAAIAFLLIANELWARRRGSTSEHSRKAVHILVGSFVAFWPLFMSWTDIRIISLAFLVVVIVSQALNIFTSIHGVERFSLGEICFALAVGLLTFVTQSHYIYAVAILQMALADGLAAIVGLHWGKTNRYKLLGQVKSVAGTLTFLVVSLAIIFIGREIAHVQLDWYLGVVAAIFATVIENLALWGIDNLLLPLVVALVLIRF